MTTQKDLKTNRHLKDIRLFFDGSKRKGLFAECNFIEGIKKPSLSGKQ